MARLVLQPLEYNFCVSCANRTDDRVKDPAFLGPRCDTCGEPHRPQDPTIVRDRLLLVDTELPIYDRQPRWACPGCEPKLLHAKPGRCPGAKVEDGQLQRCNPCALLSDDPMGGELSARPTFVWVPNPDQDILDMMATMQVQSVDADEAGVAAQQAVAADAIGEDQPAEDD